MGPLVTAFDDSVQSCQRRANTGATGPHSDLRSNQRTIVEPEVTRLGVCELALNVEYVREAA